ncbi:hypothetical protein BV25DRAFT_847610 [Artomyces pyxidatus]|uniref:Uncharacterized protein n=1 Tax=Artomyces pyxidatus TaxID=48021 RepID=A0ACB8TGU9_9AGAM|nr:hypothetical protein BV25DRAFT_847610 [Artomyces pyxidatus]
MLRSSDRVYKDVMANVLSIFADMFSLPQPPVVEDASRAGSDFKNGLPVVTLSEDSRTLYSVLAVISPIDARLPTTLDDAAPLLVVCQKYEMDDTVASIRQLVGWGKEAKTAFCEYALATRYRLRRETQEAARQTLQSPMLLDAFGEHLRHITNSALYYLADYRTRCTLAVSGCITYTVWTSAPADMSVGAMIEEGASGACADLVLSGLGKLETPRWFRDHFEKVAHNVLCGETSPILDFEAQADALEHALAEQSQVRALWSSHRPREWIRVSVDHAVRDQDGDRKG